jgi:hypothetical protein
MRLGLALFLLVVTRPVVAQTPAVPNDAFISPSRPVPVGKAPTMQAKLVKDASDEQVYSIILYRDDDVMSGLTDFAITYACGALQTGRKHDRRARFRTNDGPDGRSIHDRQYYGA